MASQQRQICRQPTPTRQRWFTSPLTASAIFALICHRIIIFLQVIKHHGARSNLAGISHQAPSTALQRSYRLDKLPTVRVPHGTFYFSPHSHSLHISENETIKHSRTPKQSKLLNDETIDIQKEKQRCASYNFDFPNYNDETPLKRRRIFMGALIATDSMEVLRAVSTEAHNIYHTVSYVESNSAPDVGVPRKWRYLDKRNGSSTSLRRLYQLFGNQTKVSVDYYITNRTENPSDTMLHETLQKEGITKRWKMNGMRPDDIGIISDADETFTRDFLRALQICDIPSFRRNQDCRVPKIIGSTMVLESSSECITKGRRWYHPDAILGECVVNVGNETVHPLAERIWKPMGFNVTHGKRVTRGVTKVNKDNVYPLWSAQDIRAAAGGTMVYNEGKFRGPTAYHFHNFFTNAEEIHVKYLTYAHADEEAMKKPVWELHEDLDLAVRCAKGNIAADVEIADILSFNDTHKSERPIYYLNRDHRRKRHIAWQSIVREEEEKYKSYLHESKGEKGI